MLHNRLQGLLVNRAAPIYGFLIGLLLLTCAGLAAAQDEDVQLRLLDVDSSAFPTMRVTFLTSNETSAPVEDLSQLALTENGSLISDVSISTNPQGVDLTFVLDANLGFSEIDDDSNLTRAAKVRDSIKRFAEFHMDPDGLDSVSIVVPDDSGLDGRFLLQNATRPQAVIDAINGYDPGPLRPTPLNAMLTQALDEMAQRAQTDRYRALLLFSDSRRLDEQLSFPLLTARANDINTPLYVAILGAEADAQEIDNARRLYEPTRASYLHMPGAADADSLYAMWQEQGNPPQLIYRSRQRQSGSNQITIALGSAADSASFEMTLAAPQLALDPAEIQVRRVGLAPDTPLSDLQPAVWPFVLEVTWPDNLPRRLVEVHAFAGDQQVPIEVELPDMPVTSLPFSLNIDEQDEGQFDLVIEVVDELGYTARSEPVPVQVSVQRPSAPTAVPTAAPTEAPPSSAFSLPALPVEYLAIGAALLGLLLFVLLWRGRARRRRAQLLLTPLEGEAILAAQDEAHDQKTILLPRLEPVSGGAAAGAILLEGENVTIGRTADAAQIVLPDRSLSPLHARIRHQGEQYWLLDEGSAEGTFLNYQRLGLAPNELADGDVIQFGTLAYAFRLRTEAELEAERSRPEPALAVIFDMDGLMVDTEPLSRQAWEQVLDEAGFGPLQDEHYEQVIGRRLQDTAEFLIEVYDLPFTAVELAQLKNDVFALIRAEGVPVMPGLRKLVDELERLEIPWGIATSSPRQVAEEIVTQLGLAESCEVIAGGDEVAHGKPAPDVYLLAAERLNVLPRHCLALEDSPPGCQAAQAAGMMVIAVPTAPAHKDEFVCAGQVLPSLEAVPAQLQKLFSELRQR
jgi:HAD superfamily hydrolase (TIGR01509 family)